MLTAMALFAQQLGPWSADLRWVEITGTKAGPVTFHLQSAGVPALLKTKKGDLVAVFQWFPANEAEAWDRIAIQRSKDNGQSWSRPKTIKVDGFPGDYMRPMDPAIVELPDGRLRLYFTSNPDRFARAGHAIYSAISSDSQKWKYETGERFKPEDQIGFDPTVVYFENKWHMITPKFRAGGYHAVSTDGLSFKQLEVIEDPGYDWIGNVAVVKGKLTFFGGGAGLWSRTRENGKWSEGKEYGVRQAGDPGVVNLGGDKLGILYVGAAR